MQFKHRKLNVKTIGEKNRADIYRNYKPGKFLLRCISRKILSAGFSAALLLALGSILPLIHTAQADESGPIMAKSLLFGEHSAGLLENADFMPSAKAGRAKSAFLGTLSLADTKMETSPPTFKKAEVLGKDPKVFPGVSLSFFSEGDHLVPLQRDVILAGSSKDSASYWDMIVQPGRIWSEAEDGEWSRASFPFSLVNSIEGETHNGVATFLYVRNEVSQLRFQIVQQTAPFYIEDYFSAWGLVPATFSQASISDLDALRSDYRSEQADQFPMADWTALEAKVGKAKLSNFESSMNKDEVIVSGLIVDGVFYHKPCKSAAGPLPYCETTNFGVWSATKTLANATALLRLAQKFGPGVFSEKVMDYVDNKGFDSAWRDVTFSDLLNMASGFGFGTTNRDPNSAEDGYLEGNYSDWYEARGLHDKIAASIDSPKLPWGPGQVVRYRDQDMFLLGAAMSEYLKRKTGEADIWKLLTEEVFKPIGIHHAATNRTIEADHSTGQPLMAYGYYPSLSDIAKIATLYQNKGRSGDQHILYGPAVETMLDAVHPHGLPTGESNRFGEGRYFNSLWYARFSPTDNCKLIIPSMLGWGGNLVVLLPNGMTGIRLAKNWDGNEAVDDYTGISTVGHQLRPLCRE